VREDPGRRLDPDSPPRELVARGDWDDVRAAVQVSVPKVEAAVLSAERTDTEYRFTLRTINSEPGWLVASREADADVSGPIPIRLTARIGHFGAPEHERQLLEAVRRRLEALAGVGTRPNR
jgi:hypothetical protein